MNKDLERLIILISNPDDFFEFRNEIYELETKLNEKLEKAEEFNKPYHGGFITLACHECKKSIVGCRMTEEEHEKSIDITVYCKECGEKLWNINLAEQEQQIKQLKEENRRLKDG